MGYPLGEVFIDDVLNVNYQPVTGLTATFSSALALILPGTYTLRIAGAEAPETGNHTAIDNLSINGTTVTAVLPGTIIAVK